MAGEACTGEGRWPGIRDYADRSEENRVGERLTERPSHTTGHTDHVPRRFPTVFNAVL